MGHMVSSESRQPNFVAQSIYTAFKRAQLMPGGIVYF